MAQDECLGITHRDDLERDKAEVRALLEQRNAVQPGQPTSDLDLVGPERPRVSVFLALLSMAADEEVELDQDALYGSLMVRVGPLFGKPRAPEPPTNEPGAIEPALALETAALPGPESTQEKSS
jgi:hypothetical protein